MILIKNMEMPKGCACCRLKDNHYGECNVAHKRIHTWMERVDYRPEWCPLTEVEAYGPEGTLYKEK